MATKSKGPVLTQREKDVLRVLRRGASNQEIAETLDVSFHTAKAYVSRLIKKFSVGTRAQLIAVQRGASS